MEGLTAETVARPGYRTGFATLEAEVEIDSLAVEGEIPGWLSGMLLRNGPAKFEAGERTVNHWFDGLAMLHRFSFADGEVSYANRFLRTKAYREAAAGRIAYQEFATDPCRSLFKRLTTMFRPALTDNCNVNLARLGDEYVAMTETPIPVAFDPGTLETLGVAVPAPGHHATAHPHHDPGRGEMLSYVTKFGRRSEYRLFAQRGGEQRIIARHRVAEPSYMHSFAISERYLALVAFPFVLNPLDLILGRRSFAESFTWRPERGTEILVFERETGALRGSYAAEPCFSFHHINAFERGEDELVIDLAAYEDAAIVEGLFLERVRRETPRSAATARVLRYTLDLGTGSVAEERIGAAQIELPRIDYRERNARPYRFAYGIGVHGDPDEAEFADQLVKVDVETGAESSWWEPGSFPGEPVFVPRPEPGRAEDEGVLLSVVLDGRASSSYLLVLDAATMRELGRARVPHHIPFGFHGQYFT
ncbi:MAG TPA: carotenoid oxygenase family protein [Solirubrobacterales bacterium]|nr:carotenoid oxygenase family protein [Solirubrobacterales bacterium]